MGVACRFLLIACVYRHACAYRYQRSLATCIGEYLVYPVVKAYTVLQYERTLAYRLHIAGLGLTLPIRTSIK